MLRAIGAALLGLLGAAGLLLLLALGAPAPAAPAFEAVRSAYRPSDAWLLDRHGELLHEQRVDPMRRRLAWTALADISPALRAAVIASEDRRFYWHGGVDGRALAAAALRRLAGGPRRGASTITMQLAALLDPGLRRHGGPRTLAQKWRQMRLARALERRWSKAEILEAYLNLVTFRGELEGVAAAAAILFGKAPHGIGEAEAAVLAALLRSPNAEQAAVAGRAWALVGVQGGSASREEIAAAAARALEHPAGAGPRSTLAPHVARQLLDGADTAAPVRSTLDASLQRFAAESLVRHLLAVRDRSVRDGAVLVVENATGDVLAYVGGSGELSSARHVDGVLARRQAGSTLKPFLYALALEQRLLTPASLLEDTPLDVAVGGGLYRPRNYDDRFRGLVTLRTALASSLNVPAVRTLELVGAELFVERLRHLGFENVRESGEWYGPSLALGSADVSLWELVNAYRTLANGGVTGPLRLVPAVTAEPAATAVTAPDAPDATAAPAGGPGRRVYAEEAAFLVSHILADRESRSTTFGLESPLATRFWSAVKTGTSKEMRDNWCIGYSRRYTVGVWVGNFSGAPMRNVSGVTGAAPVWLEVMTWLHRDSPGGPPTPPAGVVARWVDFPGGIEPGRQEWFLRGTEPAAPPPGAPAQVLAAPQPRILQPASGAVIALDPDIPPSLQRVLFEARDGGAGAAGGRGARWILDGADLGPAGRALPWAPHPGRHTLVLADGHGHTLDAVEFEVRGAAADAGEKGGQSQGR